MKVFTEKSAAPRIINTPEYQEYLEYLEEENMSKNPDDFCFMKPDRNSYSEAEFDIFIEESQMEEFDVLYADECFNSSYQIVSAAI